MIGRLSGAVPVVPVEPPEDTPGLVTPGAGVVDREGPTSHVNTQPIIPIMKTSAIRRNVELRSNFELP